jgi:hypothetical protein
VPKVLKNRGAGQPTAEQKSARERKKRDPIAQIEQDTSLDKDPAYVEAQAARVPKPPVFRYGTDQPSPRRPEHFFPWWCGLREPGQPFQIVVRADATADGAVA